MKWPFLKCKRKFFLPVGSMCWCRSLACSLCQPTGTSCRCVCFRRVHSRLKCEKHALSISHFARTAVGMAFGGVRCPRHFRTGNLGRLRTFSHFPVRGRVTCASRDSASSDRNRQIRSGQFLRLASLARCRLPPNLSILCRVTTEFGQ